MFFWRSILRKPLTKLSLANFPIKCTWHPKSWLGGVLRHVNNTGALRFPLNPAPLTSSPIATFQLSTLKRVGLANDTVTFISQKIFATWFWMGDLGSMLMTDSVDEISGAQAEVLINLILVAQSTTTPN